MTYCDCLTCGHEMKGIVSYETRQSCEPCGGQALMDHKQTLEERIREREEAHG